MGAALYQQDLKAGKHGEALVIKAFESMPSCVTVCDVSDNKDYQKEDVDFLFITRNMFKTDVFKVEVKTDSYPEKNLYFELVSNLERGTPGCLMYTQADYLAYFYEKTGSCYVFDAQKLKTTVFGHPFFFDESKKKKVTNKVGEAQYTSVGLAIPLKDLMECVAFKLDINNGAETS